MSGQWLDTNAGKPENTDLAKIEVVTERIDNIVEGLDGSKYLDAVDIRGGNIDNTPVGATTPSTGDFIDIDVDNIRIDGNTISSTDTNGDINLTPNGTGEVVISGTNFSTDSNGDVVLNSINSGDDITIASTKGLNIGSNQVVTDQQSAISYTYDGSLVTTSDAVLDILAILRTHGLIAT